MLRSMRGLLGYYRLRLRRAALDTFKAFNASYWEAGPIFVIGCLIHGLLRGWQAVTEEFFVFVSYGFAAVVVWFALRFIVNWLVAPYRLHADKEKELAALSQNNDDLTDTIQALGASEIIVSSGGMTFSRDGDNIIPYMNWLITVLNNSNNETIEAVEVHVEAIRQMDSAGSGTAIVSGALPTVHTGVKRFDLRPGMKRDVTFGRSNPDAPGSFQFGPFEQLNVYLSRPDGLFKISGKVYARGRRPIPFNIGLGVQEGAISIGAWRDDMPWPFLVKTKADDPQIPKRPAPEA